MNTFQCCLLSKLFEKDCKIVHLVQPIFYLFGVLLRLSFLNALTIVIPLLSFKGTTLACLLNKSIAHNRYLIPLLYLLNDCISAKSTAQILSLKDE